MTSRLQDTAGTIVGISVHTAERHRANIKAKLYVCKTVDLARYAVAEELA